MENLKHFIKELKYHLKWLIDFDSWWPDTRSGDGTKPPLVDPITWIRLLIVIGIIYLIWR